MKKTLEIVTELLKHMDLKRDPSNVTVSYLEIDEIRFIFKDGKYVGWYNYKTGPEKPKNSQGEKSSEPFETVTKEMFSNDGRIVGCAVGEAGLKASNGYLNLKIAFQTELEREGCEVLNFDCYETDASVIIEVLAIKLHTDIMRTITFEFYNMKISDFSDVSIDVISEWVRFKWRQKFFD